MIPSMAGKRGGSGQQTAAPRLHCSFEREERGLRRVSGGGSWAFSLLLDFSCQDRIGMARLSIEPRLLPKSQAAAYCGMSIPTFDRICPVNPVDLQLRGFRYDRRELDRWIDGLHGAVFSATDWVGAFDNDRNGSAHKRY
jgi:hypothetical protein